MSIKDLIARTRTFRRFNESAPISRETLVELVDLARLSPSGANLQPLKFMLVTDPADCAKIFPHLGWAGYMTDWPGPAEGERPTAYIIILGDKAIGTNFAKDCGIVAQSMMLGAVEAGFGGCMIGSIKRPPLMADMDISGEDYELLLILALGKPAEEVVVDPMVDGDVKYWRDEQGVHHVPKRTLDEIIIA